MKKVIIITSIEQLIEGMEVEFRHECLSKTYKAIVTDVKFKQKHRYIGCKPTRVLSVESANLTCQDGKILTVRESNFSNFQIRKIK